jgi:hypothetical protein
VLFEIESRPTEVLSGSGNPTSVPLARRHFRTLAPIVGTPTAPAPATGATGQ